MEAFCNIFIDNDQLLKIYQRELNSNAVKMPVMDLITKLACADKPERCEVYETMRKGMISVTLLILKSSILQDAD